MWSSDEEGDDGRQEDADLAMAWRDGEIRRQMLHKNAFAEAVSEAREQARQIGFEEGVKEGFSQATELGHALGHAWCGMRSGVGGKFGSRRVFFFFFFCLRGKGTKEKEDNRNNLSLCLGIIRSGCCFFDHFFLHFMSPCDDSSLLMFYTRPENSAQLSQPLLDRIQALYQDIYTFDPKAGSLSSRGRKQ